MKFFKSKICIEVVLILLVIIFAAYLRFIRLSEIPNGLYVDEALVGYNAYSILKTGRDEYGKLFPILFRFFGSYSPPLYVYLSAVAINFFDLNIFSVRLVSSLSGIAAILIIYLFSKSLKITKTLSYPLIAALVLSISPGAIFYSRLGYEVNLASTIYLLGIYLLWLGLKNSKFLIFALPTLVLSAYSAHTELYLVPLTLVSVFWFYRKTLKIKQIRKHLYIGIFLSLFLLVPLISVLNTPAFFTKGGIFYSDTIYEQASKLPKIIPHFLKVLLAFLREFFSRFFTYLSPSSLFFFADSDLQRSIPDLSFFYPWMSIPYLLGFTVLWEERKKEATKFVLIVLSSILFIGSLIKDPFSTQRLLPFFPFIALVIALGLEKIFKNIRRWQRIVLVVPLFAVSILFLWRSYFVLFPKERAKVWGYGFSELAEEIQNHPNEEFLIDQSRIKPAYIELAFYLKYPPEKFHQEIKQDIKNYYYEDILFNDKYNFGNIRTGTIFWEEDIYLKQIIVGDELSISEGQAKEHFLTKVFEIKDPLGFIVFNGFRTDPYKKCVNTNYKSLYCKGVVK
ncbi:glycosyltransferase family 39 protein [Patescibacteria group bacterium]|nr:glycosyltransferase family 39 protein [Patescibacteria group bacterium]